MKKIVNYVIFSFAILTSVAIIARSFRVSEIPNGSEFGCANCHLNPAGGGPRNAFGTEIETNFLTVPGSSGHVVWGPELAALDSDNDGVSNGEELQDPNGEWVIGQPAPGNPDLVTNPGDPSSFNMPTATIGIFSGWNLVSVPLELQDNSVASVFPNAVSSAFYFSNGYVSSNILENDLGYWIKFDNSENIPISGNNIDNNIAVVEGWNLIGGNNSAREVSEISSTPSNIIQSAFFSFNGGYTPATEVIPGKGYWVKVSEAGTIHLTSELNKKSNQTLDFEKLNNLAQLIIKDYSGNSSVLYLSENSINSNTFEMPPLPPFQVFDVRFGSNTFVESISNSPIVNINYAVFPINITVSGTDIILNGKLVKDGGSISVKNYQNTIDIKPAKIITDYTLLQNYPNPFNPSTTIKFTLPEKADVILKIYNSLGEVVADLLNGTMEAGINEVQFNAGNLSSGVYFYTINAVDELNNVFNATKKMILTK